MWKRRPFLSRPRRGAVALLVALSMGVAAGCNDSDENATNGGTQENLSGFEIAGSWTGQLRQERLAHFEVTATIGDLDDPSQNTVRYTGAIECGGNWTYLGRREAAYRFREVIDRGATQTCKGSGTVTLTPFAADGVDYEFRGGGVESFGVLGRP